MQIVIVKFSSHDIQLRQKNSRDWLEHLDCHHFWSKLDRVGKVVIPHKEIQFQKQNEKKSVRVKTRNLTDLELREEKVDGCSIENKLIFN